MLPELEINLHWRDAETYAAMIQFRNPDADGMDFRAEEPELHFEFDKLNALAADPEAYGKQLYQNLFKGKVRSSFQSALDAAKSGRAGTALRLRLAIEIAATRLHRCRWETLRDPETGQSLTTDSNVWFSRHLSSFNLKPVRLRPSQAWRVLIGIASPSNLGDLPTPLMRIDEDVELKAAKAALGNSEVVPLTGMTLANLETKLNEPFDVVYLICHGGIFGNESRLLFEDSDKKFALISGAKLADVFARQLTLPRLVVLCSCQGAGDGTAGVDPAGGALVAIGPRLAEIGVPAVLAMHGNLHVDTQRVLMKRFFVELTKKEPGGQIDHALTLARAEALANQRADFWTPVLFSRLSYGRLWRKSGFTNASPEEHALKIEGIKNLIRGHKCVPILGPGLLEGIVGLPSDLARQLVNEADYPLCPTDIEDFPRVAQFLATWMSADGMRQAYARGLALEMKRRWPGIEANGGEARGTNSQKLLRLLDALWEAKKDSDAPFGLHHILASLRCPLYVNVSGDPFLEWVLQKVGRPARVGVCPWWRGNAADFDEDDSDVSETIAKFTDQTPFVYHLYGRYDNPDSLVLTEDDYFRFLLAAAEPVDSRTEKTKSARILSGLRMQVRRNLINNSLMFLGFRLDQWDFRVLLKTLQTFGAWTSREGKCDLVVQLEPDDRFSNPARALKYLEKFYGHEKIDIYWGSAAEFLQELKDTW